MVSYCKKSSTSVVFTPTRFTFEVSPLIIKHTDTGTQSHKLTLELVVVKVDNLEVFLGDASGRLVLVHSEDRLQHLHDLLFSLVPHSRRGVDADDVVG